MGFSEQLKKARVSMGYTQQQVADALGLTASTYCGYETGKRQPDVAFRTHAGRTLGLVMNSWPPMAGSMNGQKKQWMIWWPCCWICRKRAKNNKEINP